MLPIRYQHINLLMLDKAEYRLKATQRIRSSIARAAYDKCTHMIILCICSDIDM